MADWKMEFGAYALTIGGMPVVKSLVPAERPFVTRGDADSDFFKPVRTSSGTVRVICAAGELDAAFGNAGVTDHLVRLSYSGALKWIGYMKQDVFTQAYRSGLMEMELPVCDVLEAAKGVYPQACMSMPTVGEILWQMLVELGVNSYMQYVYMTTRTPVSVLRHRINFRGVYWYDDKDLCSASWGEILEDVCKLYGWQAVMDGGKLYLLSMDYDGGRMNRVSMYALTSETPTGVEAAVDTYYASTMAASGEHKVSCYQGKKGVTVTGNVGKYEEDIFSIDWGKFNTSFNGTSPSDSKYVVKMTTNADNINMITQSLPAGSEPALYGVFQAQYIQTTSGVPTGQTAAKAYYGASAGMIGLRRNRTFEQILISAYQWEKAIFVASKNDGTTGLSLRKISKTVDVFDDLMFLNITGTIKAVANSNISNILNNDTVTGVAGSVRCRIKFGSRYLAYDERTHTVSWSNTAGTVPLYFDSSGSIIGLRDFGKILPNPMLEVPEQGLLVALEQGSGTVTFELYSLANYCMLIEALDIKVVRANYKNGKEDEKNSETRVMSNGTHDEYTVEFPFTTARSLQNGAGVVRSNDYAALTTLDATGKSAEASLADRVKNYYGTSYKMYEIGTRAATGSTGFLYVGGKKHGIVAVETDWRKGERKLTTIEIK